MTRARAKVAIIGSGNIGTDLMVKVLHLSKTLELVAMAGIDPDSDGLARAASLGVATTAQGVDGLVAMPEFADVCVVFDATSASAHHANVATLDPFDVRVVDLTPAAVGPFVVPVVNLEDHLDAPDVNMVTCGGQATIPVVAAISRVVPVQYAEIIAAISSRSAGPGTRANIDEFTQTTAQALRDLGGAAHSKAIIVLNPAEPPAIMRDTVLALVKDPGGAHEQQIREAVHAMVADVASYVPGYRLKQQVQVVPVDPASVETLAPGGAVTHQVSVFLEVEGAAHYLPAYAGNLDIMTSAALRVGEELAG